MKKLLVSIALIAGFTAVSTAQEANGLGLAERRALKDYQEKDFPAIKKNLMTAVGFEAPLDIKWEQLAQPGEADRYKEDGYWNATIFKPLTKAMTSITADKEGKDALKAKLKKIVIMYDPNTAPASNYANGIKFEAGVLTINFRPYSNVDAVDERTAAIQKLLEDNL
jgi:hypothetical protein